MLYLTFTKKTGSIVYVCIFLHKTKQNPEQILRNPSTKVGST